MKRIFMMMIILAFVVAMNVQTVQATPILTISDGSNTVTVSDNDSDGVVTYNGNLGAWIVNVITGVTMPLLGTSSNPVLDLNSINVTGITPGTLTITFTEDGFSLTNGSMKSAVGGTTDGSVSFSTLLNGFALSGLDFGPFSGGAFSDTAYYNDLTLGSSDRLGLQAVITHTGGAQVTSIDLHDKVPEPGMLVLLGSGFLGLAFFGRSIGKTK